MKLTTPEKGRVTIAVPAAAPACADDRTIQAIKYEEDFLVKNDDVLQELLQIPPDLERVKSMLAAGKYSPDQVTEIGYRYAEECWNEDVNFDSQYCEEFGYYWQEPIPIPGCHSYYLYDVFSLLLQFGLNPNYNVPDNFGLMRYVYNIVNGYIAADTLNLLLENGGDPNLGEEGETLYDDASDDMFFDAVEQFYRRRYDSQVHCWMVLLAHGGKLSNGAEPVDIFMEYSDNEKKEFDIKKLKDHRNYYIGISIGKDDLDIHVFDRRTYWEVARL